MSLGRWLLVAIQLQGTLHKVLQGPLFLHSLSERRPLLADHSRQIVVLEPFQILEKSHCSALLVCN